MRTTKVIITFFIILFAISNVHLMFVYAENNETMFNEEMVAQPDEAVPDENEEPQKETEWIIVSDALELLQLLYDKLPSAGNYGTILIHNESKTAECAGKEIDLKNVDEHLYELIVEDKEADEYIINETGFEIISTDPDMIEICSPYALKMLIVFQPYVEETYGAVTAIQNERFGWCYLFYEQARS